VTDRDVPRRVSALREGDSAERRRTLDEMLADDEALAPALAPALADCLADPDRAVQRRAADAMARLADPETARSVLTPLLVRAGSAGARWGAAYALARIGGAPAADVLAVLLDALGGADGDRRWAAAELLGTFGAAPEVEDALVALAGTGDATRRRMSLYCLRDLGARGKRIEDVAVRALEDPDPGVRLAALAAARGLGSAAVTDAVARVLEDDANPGVRRAAAVTLGACAGTPRARDALARAAAASDPALRRAAHRALGRR
jgi:HEAT repeat protein